jgi:hypothetical protein
MQVAFEMDFHAMELNDIGLCTVQGLCPVTKSPDSLADGLRAQNAPIICKKKQFLIAANLPRIINMHVHLRKQINCLKYSSSQ